MSLMTCRRSRPASPELAACVGWRAFCLQVDRDEVWIGAVPQLRDHPVSGVVVHSQGARDLADRHPPLEQGRQEPHPQGQPRVFEDGAGLVVEDPRARLAPVPLVEPQVPSAPDYGTREAVRACRPVGPPYLPQQGRALPLARRGMLGLQGRPALCLRRWLNINPVNFWSILARRLPCSI